jgi:3-oxoacyl-[acyl-carrier protein] reductase
MTQQLSGKVAIITGAASGFGAGMARAYAREGASVVLVDLNGPGAEAMAQELGANAVAIAADVTRRADIDAAVKLCVDRFGVPDIVINNAGTTHKNQPMLDVDEKTFDRMYAVNVKSIYHMSHAVVPLMRQRGKGGVILNVGSTAGIRPRPGLTWYNGSKGAVNLMSKSMAVELAPDNIRVNALCPVMGATGLLGDFMGVPDTPENRARFIATIPLGRLCTPEDMAAAAVFLGTDAAAFLTGLEMPVDGGRTI